MATRAQQTVRNAKTVPGPRVGLGCICSARSLQGGTCLRSSGTAGSARVPSASRWPIALVHPFRS
eukprot:7401402-Alexandrium_andersonii.AAC.1